MFYQTLCDNDDEQIVRNISKISYVLKWRLELLICPETQMVDVEASICEL